MGKLARWILFFCGDEEEETKNTKTKDVTETDNLSQDRDENTDNNSEE